MKKLALAALLATTAIAGADAAVIITFTGTASDATPFDAVVTIDPALLPANSGINGDLEYYSDATYFLSVVVNGQTIPLPGGTGDNYLAALSGPYGSLAISSAVNSGEPTDDTWALTIDGPGVTTTSLFGGVLLPDFQAATSLSFNLQHTGQFGADLGSSTGTITGVTYQDTATVPEPASWAMMVGGFALIGGAMRRHRASVAFA